VYIIGDVVMKKQRVIALVLAVMVIGLFGSCVTFQDRPLTANDRETVPVIGAVDTAWLSFQWFHTSLGLKKTAYKKLLELAQMQYKGNIDVRNVSVHGTFTPWVFIPTLGLFIGNIFGNFQKITATGDVVLLPETGQQLSRITTSIEQATGKAVDELISQLPINSTIAVLSISATDNDQTILVIDELEYLLVVTGKYKVVDRHTLETIRREQNFQISGEVNDETAVSIGKLLGANVVFTGSITGNNETQRLMLKALDVLTGQIVAMARESF
jgi:hypothetical protein